MRERYFYNGPLKVLKGANDDSCHAIYDGVEVYAEVNIGFTRIVAIVEYSEEEPRKPIVCPVEPVNVDLEYLKGGVKEGAVVKRRQRSEYYKKFGDWRQWRKGARASEEKDDDGDGRYCEPSGDFIKRIKDMTYEEFTKAITDNSGKKFDMQEQNHQVGGGHYASAIEPWDFIYANHIPFDEACCIKYLCRHKRKGGAEDIKKAISYCKHILKTQYKEDIDNE